MKSNLFGKLSAGVAGVALMAIGVGSTPVQAATIGINFFDRDSFTGRGSLDSGYPAFDGSFVWNSNAAANNSISNWKLDIYRPGGTGISSVTSSFYDGNDLKVNVSIESQLVSTRGTDTVGANVLSFLFYDIASFTRQTMFPVSNAAAYLLFHDRIAGQGSSNFGNIMPQIDRFGSGSSYVQKTDNTTSKWDEVRYTAVPEPSTYVGTILAFGALGAVKVLKRKQKNKETFTP